MSGVLRKRPVLLPDVCHLRLQHVPLRPQGLELRYERARPRRHVRADHAHHGPSEITSTRNTSNTLETPFVKIAALSRRSRTGAGGSRSLTKNVCAAGDAHGGERDHACRRLGCRVGGGPEGRCQLDGRRWQVCMAGWTHTRYARSSRSNERGRLLLLILRPPTPPPSPLPAAAAGVVPSTRLCRIALPHRSAAICKEKVGPRSLKRVPIPDYIRANDNYYANSAATNARVVGGRGGNRFGSGRPDESFCECCAAPCQRCRFALTYG